MESFGPGPGELLVSSGCSLWLVRSGWLSETVLSRSDVPPCSAIDTISPRWRSLVVDRGGMSDIGSSKRGSQSGFSLASAAALRQAIRIKSHWSFRISMLGIVFGSLDVISMISPSTIGRPVLAWWTCKLPSHCGRPMAVSGFVSRGMLSPRRKFPARVIHLNLTRTPFTSWLRGSKAIKLSPYKRWIRGSKDIMLEAVLIMLFSPTRRSPKALRRCAPQIKKSIRLRLTLAAVGRCSEEKGKI